MTPEQITEFQNKGKQALTHLAASMYGLQIWAEAFERRGGTPVFGDDSTFIVYLYNDMLAALALAHKATIARLRTDV
jgi:hypothetical protein